MVKRSVAFLKGNNFFEIAHFQRKRQSTAQKTLEQGVSKIYSQILGNVRK